ncbi:hypothetical protein U472_10850 [Orenia metallireducens]|uniref:Uncharacterized protein n=1 Tax=Orenia metallireducens TaxID=1413210 RepID=A0A1C0A8B9_9FIRM|nr:WYL domain-containing protein [Orenia metallireducens]OCL26487.1 hypothetical protein U472_10850 [Orenia metallireducens]
MEDRYKTKFDRLIAIAKAIKENSNLTSKDLSRLCGGVARQTISEYIKILKDVFGYPIAFNYQSNSYQYYREDYTDLDKGFTIDEIMLLLMALDSINNLAGVEIYNLQSRLISLVPIRVREEFKKVVEDFGFHQIKDTQQGNLNHITKINQAILEQKRLEFYYSPSLFEDNQKIVSPYGLAWERDKCYLIAKEEGQAGGLIINYRLDRIIELEISKEESIIPEDFSLKEYLGETWKMFSGHPERMKLKFSNKLRTLVEDNFAQRPYQIIDESKEYFILETVARGIGGIKIWLLSLGTAVEVLEPESLREAILETAQGLVEKYRK